MDAGQTGEQHRWDGVEPGALLQGEVCIRAVLVHMDIFGRYWSDRRHHSVRRRGCGFASRGERRALQLQYEVDRGPLGDDDGRWVARARLVWE